MKIGAIVLAVVVLLFGLRLVSIAFKTAFSGKILVRQGLRSHWEPSSSMNEAWKIAFRDGFMGVLLVVLAFLILF
jgi:hypothetical protein